MADGAKIAATPLAAYPTNKILLLSGVRLSSGDSSTIFWESQSAQESYFKSKKLIEEDEDTYTYLGDGFLEIEENAEELTTVNYLMFQNTEFGNKWYYAYVNSIEFDSPETSIVRFELDYWQTYFFEVRNNPCFVLREHVTDDGIGKNLKAEAVNVGKPNIEGADLMGIDDKLCVIMASTFDPETSSFDPVEGNVYGGIFSGLKLTPYSLYDQMKITDLTTVLKAANANNKQDGVVDLYAYPEELFPSSNAPVTKDYSYPKKYGDFGGYTPHNNKLYVYPFNYLVISTTTGDQRELRFELFDSDTCDFLIFGSPYNNPQVMAVPKKYNMPDATEKETNLTEGLILEGFPHYCYNVDTFKAYLAQHGGSMAIQMLAGAFGAAFAAGTGNPLGLAAVGSSIAGIGTRAADLMALSDKAPQIKGSSSGGIMAANGMLDFYLYNVRVNREYAESIDQFFDVYGYEVDEVKAPNFNTRPAWNYVKVKKSTLTGKIPSQYLARMRKDLESGFWFWHTPEKVGDFSQDNRLGG